MARPPARRRLFDELFQDFPLGYSVAPLHGDPLPSPGRIKIDVKDTGDHLIVQAEMPGVAKDKIEVTLDNGVLTIGAEISQYDADEENDKVIHSERYYGAIRRSLTLPTDVSAEETSAEYENGILVLKLPKTSKESKKRISIN